MAAEDRIAALAATDREQVHLLRLALGLVKPRKRKGQPLDVCMGRGRGWLPLCPDPLPSMQYCLEDIGASPEHVARFLDVNVSAVRRWLAGHHPPRVVHLALYWMTEHAQMHINASASRDASMYFGWCMSLQGTVEQLRAQLANLAKIGDFGSANDPSDAVPVPYRERPPEVVDQVHQVVARIAA